MQNAFEKLKEILIYPPILQYPNFEKEFLLTTDASNYALEAILSQGEVGKDLPISYASRTSAYNRKRIISYSLENTFKNRIFPFDQEEAGYFICERFYFFWIKIRLKCTFRWYILSDDIYYCR
jgi:hypothetical protein